MNIYAAGSRKTRWSLGAVACWVLDHNRIKIHESRQGSHKEI